MVSRTGTGLGRGRRRRTIQEDGPDPVDVHVGKRMRQRRTLMGMSQERLAEAFGVSFQQVQKYERGTNRISASRLHLLSKILDVPVSYFFEGLPEQVSDMDDAASAQAEAGGGEGGQSKDKMTSRETLELVRAYYRIDDPSLRRRLVDLARALGKHAKIETDAE
ncbi:MAG: helix-turn-helix transcriptional regulator [Phycisphaerales bacterium]